MDNFNNFSDRKKDSLDSLLSSLDVKIYAFNKA